MSGDDREWYHLRSNTNTRTQYGPARLGKDPPRTSNASGYRAARYAGPGYSMPYTGSGYSTSYASPENSNPYERPEYSMPYTGSRYSTSYASPANSNPYARPEYSMPYNGSGYSTPYANQGNLNPYERPEYSIPYTGSGYSTPYASPANSNPYARPEYSMPYNGSGYSTPYASPANSNPYARPEYSMPYTGAGYSTPYANEGNSNPYAGPEHSMPYTDSRYSTPYANQGNSNPYAGPTSQLPYSTSVNSWQYAGPANPTPYVGAGYSSPYAAPVNSKPYTAPENPTLYAGSGYPRQYFGPVPSPQYAHPRYSAQNDSAGEAVDQLIADLTSSLSKTRIDQRLLTRDYRPAPVSPLPRQDAIDEVVQDVLTRDLKRLGNEKLLPTDPVFDLARQFARTWDIPDEAVNSHVRLACGYFKFPVILLLNPAPTHEFMPFDKMVDGCKTLRWIEDVLNGIGLGLGDVIILDACALLGKDRIEKLGREGKRIKEQAMTEAYNVTQEMLRVINPNIILSCQCCTIFPDWNAGGHVIAQQLCSSIRSANNREVKRVYLNKRTVNVIQAYHPSGFLSDRDDHKEHHDKFGHLLKGVFRTVYYPCADWKRQCGRLQTTTPYHHNLPPQHHLASFSLVEDAHRNMYGNALYS